MRILADRYELIEQVGEGGMGVVWRAHDARLDRDVAIKLLRPFVAAEPAQRRRFAREARTLAALSNDHIVRVHDYVESGEDAFLVMEFIEGHSLAAATLGRLPIPWDEAASYARSVCDALAYAHAKGVIHRDLTPSNILIERETGRIVTTDFGLARIARSGGSVTTLGVLLGTPEYWSPEQALGRDTDAPADMYALGCILFLLLSGRLPFTGDDRLAVGLRRAHEDAPSLAKNAPEAAVALVDSLLARDPSCRPDARAAARALAASSTAVPRDQVPSHGRFDAPTVTLSAQTVRLGPKRPRRRRWLIPVLGALVGGLVGAFAAAQLLDRGPRAPNVVSLREAAARAQILRTLPNATVSVVRVYSMRVGRDRVIRQRPEPRAKVDTAARVILVVSKGTPFAQVPTFLPGTTPERARAYLERDGFTVRYRWTPSWTVPKGTVIELHPGSGMRVRRPAAVTVVVSSGWPREIVPDVQNAAVESAKQQLEAKHLRYGVVYRNTLTSAPGQVVEQHPRAGATVYDGTRIWLAVTRTPHWTQVFADSGTGSYQSAPFTVPTQWRIRYRLDGSGGGFFGSSTDVSWTRDGDFFSDGGFSADATGALHSHPVSGAGTYSLSVSPPAGTSWYVEVDALR